MDKEQFYQVLKFGDIQGETGSAVVAALDQALSINCFRKIILREETVSKC
jgi:hypothetical protein